MAPFPSFTKVWHTSPYPSISLNRSELSLAGKSVIITGGGSGIGASIAQSAALAGASKLAIIGRRTQALSDIARKIEILVGDKTQVFTVSADVANKEQVDVAFSRITAQFGEKPMDILVNNAGFFTVPIPGVSSYAATKLADAKIMDYVRQENPQMYVVNVHPGQVSETDMIGKAMKNGDIPLPDHVDDAELAGNFTVWIASPKAKFLNGKLVWVNWDVEELKENAKEIESTSILTLGLEGFSSFKY